MDEMRKATHSVVEWGLELPDGSGGVVFINRDTLTQLGEQGRYDSQFGPSLFIGDTTAERALVAAGLAERETRGGIHRTQKLMELLEEWGWLGR